MSSPEDNESEKLRVLFICTHNSARSQMAEALLRHDHGDRFEAFSAGTEKTLVKPMAVRALEQLRIDVSVLYSKTVEEAHGLFDIVVTVCDQAQLSCPYMPARVLNLHQSFKDPSNVVASELERLAAFCRSRDEIRSWISRQVPEWRAAAAVR